MVVVKLNIYPVVFDRLKGQYQPVCMVADELHE